MSKLLKLPLSTSLVLVSCLYQQLSVAAESALSNAPISDSPISDPPISEERLPEASAHIADSQPENLDEIVVTARKVSEDLQDVPMSISVLDTADLQHQAIHNLRDLSVYIPGLQQQVLPITSRLILRGVTSGDNNAFEQAVGTYVDGIYRGRMNQQQAGLFDIDRLEVLKGPQVTLYGNSSIGGAISMVTRKPSFQSGGDLLYKYEVEYEEHDVEAGFNLPVSDTLAFRVAGKWRDQGEGISKNIYSGDTEPKANDEAARLSALWLASDALTVSLRYEQGIFELRGNAFDVYKHVDGQGNPWQDSTFTGINDGELNVGNAAPFKFQETFWEMDMEETMLELEYEMSGITLTSLTGYSLYDFQQSMDVDISPATLINTYQDERYSQFSQEFRINGELGEKLEYLAGIYYQKDHFNNDYFADFNTPALVAGGFGIPFSVAETLISPFSRHILLEQETEQWAIFGSVNIEMTERLTGTIGYRYLDIQKKAKQAVRVADINQNDAFGAMIDTRWLTPELAGLLLSNTDYLADPTGYSLTLEDGQIIDPQLAPDHFVGYNIVSNGGGVTHEFDDLKRKENHSMYQAALSYQWNEHLLYYLSWSNGAKSGGFDFLYEGSDLAEVEYEDESANVYEIGFKKDWQDVRLNLAVFYGAYDDLQVSVYDGGIGFVVGNAASSTSKGVEGDIVWQVVDDVRAMFSFAYLDFTYDKFTDANCSTTDRLNTGAAVCDWSGDETPFVPKLETVLALDYRYKLSQGFEIYHLLSMSYKGSHSTASDNEPQTKQSSYRLFDYRMQLSPTSEDWSVALLAKNLLNEEYVVFTSVIPLAPGGAFANVIPKGREVAVELQYHF